MEVKRVINLVCILLSIRMILGDTVIVIILSGIPIHSMIINGYQSFSDLLLSLHTILSTSGNHSMESLEWLLSIFNSTILMVSLLISMELKYSETICLMESSIIPLLLLIHILILSIEESFFLLSMLNLSLIHIYP